MKHTVNKTLYNSKYVKLNEENPNENIEILGNTKKYKEIQRNTNMNREFLTVTKRCKELKQIEFVRHVDTSQSMHVDHNNTYSITSPSDWDKVTLIKLGECFDIMLASSDGCEDALYLGYWNDGIIM